LPRSLSRSKAYRDETYWGKRANNYKKKCIFKINKNNNFPHYFKIEY